LPPLKSRTQYFLLAKIPELQNLPLTSGLEVVEEVVETRATELQIQSSWLGSWQIGFLLQTPTPSDVTQMGWSA
jgi:hypothetical protein